MALRVGLTGGIGSGKSEVARRLAERGAVVIDADVLAREALGTGTPGLARAVAELGDGILTSTGDLDRARLGELVFVDATARRRLEAIVHPEVRRRAGELEHEAVAADPGAVVVHDIPLLVEARGTEGFDVVVVVDVPADVQLARLVSGRGMSETAARSRIAAQATREQRLAVADVVVDNSRSLADLDERVASVWAELAVLAEGSSGRGESAARGGLAP